MSLKGLKLKQSLTATAGSSTNAASLPQNSEDAISRFLFPQNCHERSHIPPPCMQRRNVTPLIPTFVDRVQQSSKTVTSAPESILSLGSIGASKL